MDRELKAEWIAALTSRDYPQGKDYLNDRGNYCCLGVLCELLVDKGLVQAEEAEYFIRYDGEIAVLPSSVIEMTGLDDAGTLKNPFFILDNDGFERRIHSLTEANDNGMTFDQIAKIIEREF